MDASFKKSLENALKHYDKVIFLYQPSKELCTELRTILKNEKRNLLLLTTAEAPDFPCDQRKLQEEECRWLLDLYFSYSFSDRFIFLTEQRNYPWPFIDNFVEMGLLAKGEVLEALLV